MRAEKASTRGLCLLATGFEWSGRSELLLVFGTVLMLHSQSPDCLVFPFVFILTETRTKGGVTFSGFFTQ